MRMTLIELESSALVSAIAEAVALGKKLENLRLRGLLGTAEFEQTICPECLVKVSQISKGGN